MLRNTLTILSVLVATLISTASTIAAAPGPANGDTVYRLDESASYQVGCFDPCDCPLQEPQPLYGVFVLGPVIIGDAVDFREVTDIRWKVPFAEPPLEISGSGMYRITNYGEPQMHALDLELSINGGPTQYFFSDFVLVTSNDGSIEIPISMNGIFCFDTLIHVNASPVPPTEILNYRLVNGSTFQQGCFNNCACPLQAPRKMGGKFLLVPVINFGTWVEYAVIRVDFKVRPATLNTPVTTLTGSGWYVLVQGFAGPMHSLDLDLSLNNGPPAHFDSGFLNTAPIFPTIWIQVDMNDLICFDTLLTIHAKPVNFAELTDGSPLPGSQ